MFANAVIMVINTLLTTAVNAITTVVNVLPTSPFVGLDLTLPTKVVAYMNWIFPFTEILEILTLWVASILVYYGASVLLRVTKVID